ncbi:MAG: YkgJ family cysteine cluster protein [Bacteroidetes bacterium]|nr:YkgJ family cysteine cluster protein [Bacteroidota bacterium]
MAIFNISNYKRRATRKKKALAAFMRKLGKSTRKGLQKIALETDKEVWKEVACLDCGNCCKQMTPTFSNKDIKRISAHFEMTPKEFHKKWLKKDSSKDIVNKQTPCQFLGKDLKCSIYAIRPQDCADFPHFTRSNFKYQVQEKTYINNIGYCPATLLFVEKLEAKLADLI